MLMGELANVQIINCLCNMPAVGMRQAYYITRWEIANWLIAAESSDCCWSSESSGSSESSDSNNPCRKITGFFCKDYCFGPKRMFLSGYLRSSHRKSPIFLQGLSFDIQNVILSKWCRDSIARAEQKYRRFFAQLVTKALQMALKSPNHCPALGAG